MNGGFFLDTNILIYSFDAGSPKKAAQSGEIQALKWKGLPFSPYL
jgi:predicted nucleic acid-binding protein